MRLQHRACPLQQARAHSEAGTPGWFVPGRPAPGMARSSFAAWAVWTGSRSVHLSRRFSPFFCRTRRMGSQRPSSSKMRRRRKARSTGKAVAALRPAPPPSAWCFPRPPGPAPARPRALPAPRPPGPAPSRLCVQIAPAPSSPPGGSLVRPKAHPFLTGHLAPSRQPFLPHGLSPPLPLRALAWNGPVAAESRVRTHAGV